MSHRIALALLAALALTPAMALVALADDGTTNASATPPPSFRPPSAVLRHVDAPVAVSAAGAVPAKRELVVFVGGYQTCSCDDPTFDDLVARATAAGYDVRRFGQDPRYPYDTYGHIDANARNLRDEIRSVSGGYSAVHVVTHSMGGVVADRAFAQGLSRGDGVATYVSLSAPHSGSDAAKAVTLVDALGPSELVHRLASLAGLETRSEAVADLATARPVPPPAGVVRLDLRASTDVLVTGRDARDPGVPSRILSGSWDGHGGILSDPAALELTLRTIATRRVPPEERSQASVEAEQRWSDVWTALAVAGLVSLALLLIVRRRVLGGLTLEDILLQRFVPARRRHCG